MIHEMAGHHLGMHTIIVVSIHLLLMVRVREACGKGRREE